MITRILLVFGSGISLVIALYCAHAFSAHYEREIQTAQISIGPSGLSLPRFVSLKSDRVNVRVGPNQHKYAVAWSYHRQGLPVEIIQEYENWRRIRDSDGDMGWINQALLSSKRTVIITPWEKNEDQLQVMRWKPVDDAEVIAWIEPGVICKVRQCNGKWCKLEIENRNGWMKQNQLWGVYPDEKIE